MASYPAGKLRHRMSLQRPDYSVDSTSGAQVLNGWVEVAKIFAAIEPLSAREFMAANAEQARIDTRIVIRNREIYTTWRLVHLVHGVAGRQFNIHGVLSDKDSGLDYLTLPCSTGVNDGR